MLESLDLVVYQQNESLRQLRRVLQSDVVQSLYYQDGVQVKRRIVLWCGKPLDGGGGVDWDGGSGDDSFVSAWRAGSRDDHVSGLDSS